MRYRRGGHPGQYVNTGSRLHRLPPAAKLSIGWLLSICALLSPTGSWTAVLALLCVLLYGFARLGPGALRKDAFLVILQAPLVLLVLVFREGMAGLSPALMVSMRLALASLPGLWVQRTTRACDLAEMLGRVLPSRVAFVFAMTLRFLPLIARDAREIHALQVLRGAPVRPRDLLNPLNWSEACHSFAIPMVIRTLNLADQVSVAARQRGVETAACLPQTAWRTGAQTVFSSATPVTGGLPWIEK
jgi:energy-coupling factor transport system permease protein